MYVLRDVRLLHNPTCNVINKRYYNAAVFPSQAFGCSWSLGLAWLTCPSTPPAADTGDCIVYQLACQTGRPGQLFTHLISLRDKASFDTDSRQLVRMDTHTNTGRLPNARVHKCAAACVPARKRAAQTHGCAGSHWPLGRVHLGTQTEKCGWTVTPRQLVVKGCLSVCALIWLIVFSQASSASVCLFFLLFSAAIK